MQIDRQTETHRGREPDRQRHRFFFLFYCCFILCLHTCLPRCGTRKDSLQRWRHNDRTCTVQLPCASTRDRPVQRQGPHRQGLAYPCLRDLGTNVQRGRQPAVKQHFRPSHAAIVARIVIALHCDKGFVHFTPPRLHIWEGTGVQQGSHWGATGRPLGSEGRATGDRLWSHWAATG